ncbi:MAG: flagellar biosynthesis protein FliQ [Clostridiales bacterium]|nr:flagellar biosynthesis protein FliQ [Clostridiales bacterium]
MTQGDVIAILQDAIFTTIKASMPMLLVAIVVGLIVSIFQATTQINEQTLAFVPKILCILLSILFFGGYILNTLSDFVVRLYGSVGGFLG